MARKHNKKLFIIDTNVLLHDYKCIYNFEENDVIIPIVVLEELDKFKKAMIRSISMQGVLPGSLTNYQVIWLLTANIPLGENLGNFILRPAGFFGESQSVIS